MLFGEDLAKDDGEDADQRIGRARVFARVEPLQKTRIVDGLHRAGHFSAVTGDGVNDAPALDRANIGIAMEKAGTDVARNAGDLILTDDNFASIVAGIEQGRVAYDNVRKAVCRSGSIQHTLRSRNGLMAATRPSNTPGHAGQRISPYTHSTQCRAIQVTIEDNLGPLRTVGRLVKNSLGVQPQYL